MSRLSQGITVVISAWQAQDFITECLDSIAKQDWDFTQLEVLIGVDNCMTTFKKIREIELNYVQLNMKVLWFKQNCGTYIVSNTLVSIAKYNNILRFDADDYMQPFMIKEIMSQDDRFNVIEFGMTNFDNDTKTIEHHNKLSEGCRFYTKQLFILAGGYMPWRHSADSEFLNRIKPITSAIWIKKSLFMRRRHTAQLTKAPLTCIGSPERKSKAALVRDNYDNGIIQIPLITCNDYRLVPKKRITPRMIQREIKKFGEGVLCTDIIKAVLQHHQSIITYRQEPIHHKELPVVEKYYEKSKEELLYGKTLTLWKRYR